MYKMIPQQDVEAFRHFINTTPPSDLPSPSRPEGAFDDMDALRRAMTGRGRTKSAAKRMALDQSHRDQLDDRDVSPELEGLREYLRTLGLTDDEIAQACAAATEGRAQAMDEPEPFPGMPKPGGTMVPLDRTQHGMDARSAALALAGRIKVEPGGPSYTRPPDTAESSAASDFFQRFPDAARIKVV